jgi:hypothetical protein
MADLGYPDITFSNKVAGRALPIQWNDGQRAARTLG